MAKTVYSFRIAFQSEDELNELKQQEQVNPDTLVLTTLPDGQPSFKTVFCSAFNEDEAIQRVDSYVSQTPYKDIEDGKMV